MRAVSEEHTRPFRLEAEATPRFTLSANRPPARAVEQSANNRSARHVFGPGASALT